MVNTPGKVEDHPLGPYSYRDGLLCCGETEIAPIAERFGTPLYVYSDTGIRAGYARFADAFAMLRPHIHFAAKACGNVRILRDLVSMGAGIDAVSGGEVERAWLAGCPMERVAFAGVGKSEAEIRAALRGSYSPLAGTHVPERFGVGTPENRGPVGLFNVESVSEYERLDRLSCELGIPARVAVRVNPDVDAKTHPYTTTGRARNKFGIALDDAEGLYTRWAAVRSEGEPGAHPVGLHMHIGSPVYDAEPFAEATRALVASARRLRDAGARVDVLDLGGGWPSAYEPGQVRDLGAFARLVTNSLGDDLELGTEIHLEPGRSIISNSAVLLTRVEYVKRTPLKRFVICDAGMHALLRPSLYGAKHAIWPVVAPSGPFDSIPGSDPHAIPADIVGPICETGDFLGLDRDLPEITPGSLLAVFGAGAYGMSMASTYNQHPRPAEALLGGDGTVSLIRQREHAADMLRDEAAVWDCDAP